MPPKKAQPVRCCDTVHPHLSVPLFSGRVGVRCGTSAAVPFRFRGKLAMAAMPQMPLPAGRPDALLLLWLRLIRTKPFSPQPGPHEFFTMSVSNGPALQGCGGGHARKRSGQEGRRRAVGLTRICREADDEHSMVQRAVARAIKDPGFVAPER